MGTHRITATVEQTNVTPNVNIEQTEEHTNPLDQITVYSGKTITRRTSSPMTPITLAELIEQIISSPSISKAVDEIRALGATMTGVEEHDEQIKDKQNELKRENLPYIPFGRFRDHYLCDENLEEIRYEV